MLKCKICGTEFPAIEERHYIARDNSRVGVVVALSKNEEKIYDAYDCSMCGSQIITQERKRILEPDSIYNFNDSKAEEVDEEMLDFNTVSSNHEDLIKHPDHYTAGRKYEPKDVIRDWNLNFNLGSAMKYISRAGRKGDIILDLKKSIEFIGFEIEYLEQERDKDNDKD